jgi:hypothetical protein
MLIRENYAYIKNNITNLHILPLKDVPNILLGRKNGVSCMAHFYYIQSSNTCVCVENKLADYS